MKTKKAWTVDDAVRVSDMSQFSSVIREHGMLMRVTMAASLGNVSRQHLHRLIDEGLFRRFYIFGELHISQTEFELWFDGRVPRNAQLEFA